MNAILAGAIFSLVLLVGILLCIEAGRRMGARRFSVEGESSTRGLGAMEGALFGLLGLVLAFSYSGALTRFDARRQLIVQEANDIGTAWLRIDLLPEKSQPAMRELFRRYLDSRIETYRKMPDIDAAMAEVKRCVAIQKEIWSLAVSASPEVPSPQTQILLLPALNTMFDIATTRVEAARIHPPVAVFAMLGIVTLACSLFAGFDMGCKPRLNLLHSIAFALVLSVTVYLIVDLEYPRLGMIQITRSDQVLLSLRESMN